MCKMILKDFHIFSYYVFIDLITLYLEAKPFCGFVLVTFLVGTSASVLETYHWDTGEEDLRVLLQALRSQTSYDWNFFGVKKREKDVFFTEDVGTKQMEMREALCNKTGSCGNWETDILWNHNATWMIPTSPEKVVCIPKILISDMTDLKDDSEGHATNDTQRNPTIGSFQDFVSRCRILWSPTRIAVARPVWCNRFAIVVFKPVTDLTQDSNKIWEVLAEDSLPCFIID